MQTSTAEPIMEHRKSNVQLSTEHLTRCESTGQLLGGDLQAAQNRYFLHHHSPSHHNAVMRRLGSLGDHLQRLQRHNRNHIHKHDRKLNYTSSDGSHTGLRLVKSGFDISHSTARREHARHSDLEFTLLPPAVDDTLISVTKTQVVRGHELVPATCSRFSGKCEACRHTVHATKYFYCRNCPTVCHNSKSCWTLMQRPCPAADLGVFGWGEGDTLSQVAVHTYETGHEFNFAAARIIVHAGSMTGRELIEARTSDDNSVNRCIELVPAYVALRKYLQTQGTQTTSVSLQRELDLEFVFLGGTKPPVVNKCAECGRVLERRFGYACDQEVGIPAAKLRRREKKRKVHKWHLEEEGKKQKDKSHEENGETGAVECPANGYEQSHRSPRHLRSLLPALVARDGHSGRTDGQQQQVAKRVLVCHYTGRYFCERCHWGDEWYIPGCIFILNDCEKHPVSRTAYLKLRVLWETALIRAPPYWYNDNEEAAKVYRLRTRLQCMSRYFAACSDAWNVKEIVNNTQAPHLLGQPNLLRMVDVIDILNKTLYPRLEKKFYLIDSHIRECRMCRSVNRLCCVCKRGKSLFSYDENVGVCRICDKVFHLSCSEVTNLCLACDTAVMRVPST